MPDQTDRSGSRIDGKYELVRLVGRGGVGSVYAARQLQLDRQVAVKLLRPEVTADERAVARFKREARSAARIEHPNAVRVYDFGATEDGVAYIVMEYVEGVSLRVVMRRTRVLPFDVVLEVAWQAAAGVAAAHEHGIVHRDLKPENLIVRVADDGAISVKVVDFGLAKLVEGDATQITNPAEMVGTPKYMAPEQFSGDDVDERADVYALGVILYEMLAGRPPFDGTVSEIVGKHLYAEPPSFASAGVEAPEGVEQVVRRALAKKPAERPASAIELARAVARCFGIDVTPGTALIMPPALTSREPLRFDGDGEPAVGAEPGVQPADGYLTNVGSRDEVQTQLRPAAPRPAPTTELLAPPLVAPPRRAWVLPVVGGLLVVLTAAALAGVLAVRRMREPPPPPPPPPPLAATPAVVPAAPSPSPSGAYMPPRGAEKVEEREGVPLYIDGKIVIYAGRGAITKGATLEIVDPETGRAERFPLEPNDKGTKWVVKRGAHSDPGGLTVGELVPEGAAVEVVIRNPDGSATPPSLVDRTDE